jgi:DNA-binding IclR family transcriptional regulator
MPNRNSSDGSRGRKSTSAIDKAFAAVMVLRRSPSPLTLTAIAAEVGIAPSTAHSLLNDLLAQGAVVVDEDKRYRLGPALYYIGAAYARGTAIFRSTWIELVALANELSMTAAVAVPWDNHHLIIASHQGGDSDLNVAFGGRVPLDGGSWGKAHFAALGTEPATLTKYTNNTIVEPKLYRAELARTRERGFATDFEEFSPGVAGLCSSVTSDVAYEGLASVLVPLARVSPEELEQVGRRLSALAARASMSLGDSTRVAVVGEA